ncbi:sugar transferase [Bacillus sp. EB106-08-02-XG196]|uniref:sugar transferase n=1 Tax=Bacillus sp. EB106-08-02-XG196 TaxID=2737049 RepID=UPI0015C4CB5D|nr:sugar transferase [Bacillus sp. EB106-08-02-XG196]NWQ39504.1 sugar transferase [Bacillus sp. EB106-08-02-XG196]
MLGNRANVEQVPYLTKKEYAYTSSKKEKFLYDLYLYIKRLVDIIGSMTLLLLCAPFFVFISLLYLTGENKGPVFFKQTRIGENGKEFKIYKFRSMIINAEDKLTANKELYKKYVANSYKLDPKEDPRITNIGRFLRKTSLDELPQLINVLKGEMSLVGPRPVVREELKEYSSKLEDFLSVKPGVTGYWQVSGRSNVVYPERVDVELFYVYNASLLLDIKILLKTVLIVITKKGAY